MGEADEIGDGGTADGGGGSVNNRLSVEVNVPEAVREVASALQKDLFVVQHEHLFGIKLDVVS